MQYINSWDNCVRAESYSKLKFPNTYYLAYRDLPAIISRHASGNSALDFGCGTGRSTRFLKDLGFETTGIDISAEMIAKAHEQDPQGDYLLVKDGNYKSISKKFDLILSVFTFDNIPGAFNRLNILKGLKELLSDEGCMILLDSSSHLYTHEWASFSTIDFHENNLARSGDIVKVRMTDVEDKTPVEDYLWEEHDYKIMFDNARLDLIKMYAPLGKPEEPYFWKSELTIAPWLIYVLKKNSKLNNEK